MSRAPPTPPAIVKAPVKKGRPLGSTNANKKRKRVSAKAKRRLPRSPPLAIPQPSSQEAAAREQARSQGLKQSKIGDFVQSSVGKVNVSFDGRLEAFSEDQLRTLFAMLRAKKAFSKEQLALAVELWNTNPDPECFVFRHGNRSDDAEAVHLATFDPENAEHVLFRARGI